MHLIQSLASGINGAANGSVTLLKRGTSTPTIYYPDFEATQTLNAQPIALDSNGGVVVYVSELVDVLVRDSSGVLVREFVAGDNAQAVEVTSPAFTGINYTSGQSGVGLPTTLQQTFASLLSSFGTTDYKVLVNGSAVTMQVAVAGLAGVLFNVKSYGALGNGAADDGTAIDAAQTAAVAAGGGIVFFPPGTYRRTTTLALAAGVTLMGSGGRASKLAFDNAALVQGVLFAGGTPTTGIQGLWIGAITAFPGILLYQSAAGRLVVRDCTLGADANVTGNLFRNDGTTFASMTLLSGCWFEAKAGAVSMLFGLAQANRTIFHDCDVVNSQATGVNHADYIGGWTFEACRFDSSTVSAGVTKYINCAPNPIFGGGTIRGCYFGDNATIKPIAIFNTLATPSVDPLESDNIFGQALGFTNITPYAYTTDGYANPGSTRIGAHLSRLASVECYGTHTAATITVNPKANGVTTIQQTSGAALAMSGTFGSQGDTWVLQVTNTSGGALTVTPNGLWFGNVDGAATFNVANNTTRRIQFSFLPLVTGSGGFWQQTAPSVQS